MRPPSHIGGRPITRPSPQLARRPSIRGILKNNFACCLALGLFSHVASHWVCFRMLPHIGFALVGNSKHTPIPPLCHTNAKRISFHGDALWMTAFAEGDIWGRNRWLYSPCACIIGAVSECSELLYNRPSGVAFSPIHPPPPHPSCCLCWGVGWGAAAAAAAGAASCWSPAAAAGAAFCWSPGGPPLLLLPTAAAGAASAPPHLLPECNT